MTKSLYPGTLAITLNVLIRAEKGAALTPELVDTALAATSQFKPGPESFEIVRADLDRLHFIGDDGRLTPLADKYATMWRDHLAKVARGEA